ncbi:DNA excision repair protein ERCC-6-like [Panulirus ornatus]|uniref:DNA excision repair protein ERCC-6-like n=1 Tax=Panulirus ornatus TaxID=150431 RepID=UPI003A8A2904
MEVQGMEKCPPLGVSVVETMHRHGDSNMEFIDDIKPDEGHCSSAEMSEKVIHSSSSILSKLLSGKVDNNVTTNDDKSSLAQDLQDQDDELRALGISVVDQLSLERDVEAAVDKAVTKHTRKQRLQILKKEVKDVKIHLKQAENKLNDLSKRLSGMRQRVVDPRMVMSVEKEISEKTQNLKDLRARESFLQKKLESAEANEEELDDFDLEDGEVLDNDYEQAEENKEIKKISDIERDRLIREGQMTPFGTAMTNSKTVAVLQPSHTQVETGLAIAAFQKRSINKRPAKAEMISSGEMTPFGTVVKTSDKSTEPSKGSPGKLQAGMSDFEKYLQDQIDRQKQHSEVCKSKKSSGDPTYGVPRKRNKKIKEYIGSTEYDEARNEDNDEGTSLLAIKKHIKAEFEAKVNRSQGPEVRKKSKRGDPLRMHILHPKKKKKEKVLGTITSNLEADQYKRTPRKILSERVSFEGIDSDVDAESRSGSEYVPSEVDEDDVQDDFDAEKTKLERQKSYSIEKMDKAQIKPRKKKKRDDYEWSDDDVPKSKRRKSCKAKDDGNLEDYVRRIEQWKKERLKMKQEKILRGEDLDLEEEEEEGYEEFDGGYRIPLVIWNKLYRYQRTCVKWLWELHGQSCGGILGDEMGLGKTIQMISFLVGLSYSCLKSLRQPWKGLGPVLIVCPATVLHQWVKEFHKWWPPFRVAVLHESGTFTGKRPALIHNINRNGGILVTSYTGVRDQLETLLQYDWHYIILDEGHKIRNPEAQITVALKRFHTPHRLILSGSPIQNSLKELWSLFDFVFPGKLGTLPVFLQQFAVPITQGGYANASKLEVQTAFKCASVLRDTINPYLLRRMKNDVRSHLSLPDKNEQVLFCGLSEEQRHVYREYIEGDQVKSIMNGRLKVFVGLINLRKICNHPDLYTGGPRRYDGDDWNSGLQPEMKYGWWTRSGKMHVLHSVLRLWLRQGHRVLLFTQSRQMMCILERFLLDEHYCYLKMDGTTTVSSRQPLIEKFNCDPSYFVFLMTTRVGGLGVNLTGADRVVIFDPDWNPSTDSQARERAWRIGQLRHVTIYRLLTAGTIEEKIYHRQIFKQFLTNRVLKDPKQQRFFKTNDLYELFSLNEGDKEKTESSAIFAGTDSEIKVDVKENSKDDDTEKQASQKTPNSKEKREVTSCRETSRELHTSRFVGDKERRKTKIMQEKTREKSGDQSLISVNISKLKQMRELARSLSQKIGGKCSSKEDTKIGRGKEEDMMTDMDDSQNYDGGDIGSNKEKDEVGIAVKKQLSQDQRAQGMQEVRIKVAPVDMENMLQVSASNLEDIIKSGKGIEEKPVDDILLQNVPNLTNNLNITSDSNSKIHEVNESNMKSNQLETHTFSNRVGMSVLEDNERHKREHKKKDEYKEKENRKRSKKKGRKFSGVRIEYLVKKRNYHKTEEEEKAQLENAKSQDQYVLEKLFQKSGVHTALSHDAIVNNSDNDYLLMEGEAERVAKEALKAVRASRAQCFRPRLRGEPSQSLKSKPRFGKKTNRIFNDSGDKEISEVKEVKHKDKKMPMFNGGIEEVGEDESSNTSEGRELFSPFKKSKGLAEGSSGVLSSSQLLSRMRHRNRGIAMDSEDEDSRSSDGYDPNYPSTAINGTESIEPEIQENIDLLADIRNFVAFQAEVDGRASTLEIIGRFRDRLPPEQTPFFKALLTQVCDFHRETTGEGMWTLKGEFR